MERAQRAIAKTNEVSGDQKTVAHFAGLKPGISRDPLGFRSQSLAPPQALCYRSAPRANVDGDLIRAP